MVLPLAVQNAIGQTMADAEFVRSELMETTSFFQRTPMLEDDSAYAGKGHSFTSDVRLIGWQSNGEVSTRADHWIAGWMLAMTLGKEAFTAGVGGAANTHLLSWLDAADAAPLANIYIEDTVGLKRKWLDMACSQVVIGASKVGACTIKGTFMGGGQVISGALAAIPDYEVKPPLLYGQNAVVMLGPTGAPVSMVPRVRSWEATFSHAVEEVRQPGVGDYAAFLRYGLPTMKLNITIDANDSADIQTWMEERTELECRIVITSAGTTLTLDWPRIILPKSDLGEQDKYVGYTLQLDEKSILKPTGTEIFTASLTNLVDEYLVPAA